MEPSEITAEDAQMTIDALRKEAENLPELTLDEINAEISAVRAAKTEKA